MDPKRKGGVLGALCQTGNQQNSKPMSAEEHFAKRQKQIEESDRKREEFLANISPATKKKIRRIQRRRRLK